MKHFSFILFCIAMSLQAYPRSRFDFSPTKKYLFEQPNSTDLVIPPRPKPKAVWTDKIFTEKIITEFYRKYEEKFGAFETLRLTRDFPKVEDQYVIDSISYQEKNISETEKVNAVGEYTVLRIVEYHFDNYFKNTPEVKKIYETKYFLTNAEVKINKKSSVKIKYLLSDNSLQSSYKLGSLFISYKMEFKSLNHGLFSKSEELLYFAKNITTQLNIHGHYKLVEQSYLLVLQKPISKTIAASISYSGNSLIQNGQLRESRILFGISL